MSRTAAYALLLTLYRLDDVCVRFPDRRLDAGVAASDGATTNVHDLRHRFLHSLSRAVEPLAPKAPHAPRR